MEVNKNIQQEDKHTKHSNDTRTHNNDTIENKHEEENGNKNPFNEGHIEKTVQEQHVISKIKRDKKTANRKIKKQHEENTRIHKHSQNSTEEAI